MKSAPLLSLLATLSIVSGYWDYCAPNKWKAGEDLNSLEGTTIPIRCGIELAPRRLLPGEVNCRYRTSLSHLASAAKRKEDLPDKLALCRQIVDRYFDGGTVKDFVRLNPELEGDCSNFDLNRDWCVRGFLEPLRAYNGKCGPHFNDATCIGTQKQCCNSKTWTCGDKEEVLPDDRLYLHSGVSRCAHFPTHSQKNRDGSCSPGTCYEGACRGHMVFSLDGNCGSQHGDLICGGKWGTCCGKEGRCGDGPEFCAAEKCRSGLCWSTNTPEEKTQQDFDQFLEEQLGYAGGTTTDGACGEKKGYTCGDYNFGRCCGKDGRCGHGKPACGEGCQPQFGKCASTHKFIPPR